MKKQRALGQHMWVLVVISLLALGLSGCRKVPSKVIFQVQDYVRVYKNNASLTKTTHIFVPKGKTLKNSTKYIHFVETNHKINKAKIKIMFKRMKTFIKTRLRTNPHKGNDKRYCTVRRILGQKRLIKFIIVFNPKNFHILEYQQVLQGKQLQEDIETLCEDEAGDFNDLEALGNQYFGRIEST